MSGYRSDLTTSTILSASLFVRPSRHRPTLHFLLLSIFSSVQHVGAVFFCVKLRCLQCTLQTQTPCYYCGCFVLILSVLFFFISFHFPIEICTRCFSVKTSAIDLNLWHKVQNGLDSRYSIFWKSDLRTKIRAIWNFSPTPRLFRLAANAVTANPYFSETGSRVQAAACLAAVC